MKRLCISAIFCALCFNLMAQVYVTCPDCGRKFAVNEGLVQTDSSPKKTSSTTQCKAITQKGTQCSRKAQNGSEYCWQHDKESSSQKQSSTQQSTTSSGQCRATTKSGSRCSRKATNNGYCWQHSK